VNRPCSDNLAQDESRDKPRLRAPYLVRLIKPNLIASHDWHVQPNCQRSLRATRLSGTLGSSLRTRVRSVLELDALCRNSLFQEFDPVEPHFYFFALSLAPDFGAKCAHGRHSAFLRELFKGTKAPPVCQGGKPGRNLVPSIDGLLWCQVCKPGTKSKRAQKSSRSAYFKEQPAKKPASAETDARKPRLPGSAMACSL
jgi:hypothetical protein